jgi:hypothetical protein
VQKICTHFKQASEIFKYVFDIAAREYSDKDEILGRNPGGDETPTEIDSHEAHFIIHPDYSSPNSPGNESDGRQAHQNHLHLQLGKNNNGGVVRTR